MNTQTALTLKAINGSLNISKVTSAIAQTVNKLDDKDVKEIILAYITYKAVCFVCTNKGKLTIAFSDKKIILGGEDTSST